MIRFILLQPLSRLFCILGAFPGFVGILMDGDGAGPGEKDGFFRQSRLQSLKGDMH